MAAGTCFRIFTLGEGYFMKTDFYVEVHGEQMDYTKLIETAKEIWKADGNKIKDIEYLQLYFNTDEKTCYYVINNESKGSFAV